MGAIKKILRLENMPSQGRREGGGMGCQQGEILVYVLKKT